VDGTSIWAGDGVHLTSNASRVATRKLMVDLAKGGEEGEPATKRTRLESAVPVPAPAEKKVAAKGQPSLTPPRPCPPPPALAIWSAAAVPPWAWSRPPKPFPQGGRTGEGQPARRLLRGRSWPQRPLMGGQRGLWGRW
jgi:hypothetical protein